MADWNVLSANVPRIYYKDPAIDETADISTHVASVGITGVLCQGSGEYGEGLPWFRKLLQAASGPEWYYISNDTFASFSQKYSPPLYLDDGYQDYDYSIFVRFFKALLPDFYRNSIPIEYAPEPSDQAC